MLGKKPPQPDETLTLKMKTLLFVAILFFFTFFAKAQGKITTVFISENMNDFVFENLPNRIEIFFQTQADLRNKKFSLKIPIGGIVEHINGNVFNITPTKTTGTLFIYLYKGQVKADSGIIFTRPAPDPIIWIHPHIGHSNPSPSTIDSIECVLDLHRRDRYKLRVIGFNLIIKDNFNDTLYSSTVHCNKFSDGDRKALKYIIEKYGNTYLISLANIEVTDDKYYNNKFSRDNIRIFKSTKSTE